MKQGARRTLVERVSKQLIECTGILAVTLMVTPSLSIGGTSPSAPKPPAPRPAPPAPTPPRPSVPVTPSAVVVPGGRANAAAQAIPSLPIAQEAARMIMGSGNPNVTVSADRARAWMALNNADRTARTQAHLTWARANGNPNPGYSVDNLAYEASRLTHVFATPGGNAGTQSQPALPLKVEAMRMVLNTPDPRGLPAQINDGTRALWHRKTPSEKQARAAEWARWVHETDRRPSVDVGQLVSTADALAGGR